MSGFIIFLVETELLPFPPKSLSLNMSFPQYITQLRNTTHAHKVCFFVAIIYKVERTKKKRLLYPPHNLIFNHWVKAEIGIQKGIYPTHASQFFFNHDPLEDNTIHSVRVILRHPHREFLASRYPFIYYYPLPPIFNSSIQLD